jgi:4-hydroxy-tetrahydrodipicolinate synthase
MRKSFRGLIAYPITPLTVDGDPHLGRVAGLAAAAAAAGVDGVSVLATSGAGISFGRAERQAVAEAAVQAVGPWRTPVYVAVSAPSTREIVALARDADAAGAAGLLLTPFAYLPLSDEEVRSLFIEVGDASSLPICFYNKPAQMHYDLSADMLHELARSAPIAGVKETSLRDGLTARVQSLRDAGGPDVAVGLSGELALLRDQPAADAWHTGWQHSSRSTTQTSGADTPPERRRGSLSSDYGQSRSVWRRFREALAHFTPWRHCSEPRRRPHAARSRRRRRKTSRSLAVWSSNPRIGACHASSSFSRSHLSRTAKASPWRTGRSTSPCCPPSSRMPRPPRSPTRSPRRHPPRRP